MSVAHAQNHSVAGTTAVVADKDTVTSKVRKHEGGLSRPFQEERGRRETGFPGNAKGLRRNGKGIQYKEKGSLDLEGTRKPLSLMQQLCAKTVSLYQTHSPCH